jgi:hypothetical protein
VSPQFELDIAEVRRRCGRCWAAGREIIGVFPSCTRPLLLASKRPGPSDRSSGVGWASEVTVHMPKQSRFNKRSVGPPGEKRPTRPAWLLLWLAAVILVATTREASGCRFPTTNKRSPKEAERGRPAMRPGKSSTRY